MKHSYNDKFIRFELSESTIPKKAMALCDHISCALKEADVYRSKLSQELLSMGGMSGVKTRHLCNHIASMKDARYLEIGSWKGSTLCAAMFQNAMRCVAIDNWSQFGGPKNEFLINFNKFQGDNEASFIEKDCWEVDVREIGPFNIYLYDGAHPEDCQVKALDHYLPCLDKQFIYLVDDWNFIGVRKGTMRGIENNDLTVHLHVEIRTTQNNKSAWKQRPPHKSHQHSDWHNGLSVFVFEQK